MLSICLLLSVAATQSVKEIATDVTAFDTHNDSIVYVKTTFDVISYDHLSGKHVRLLSVRNCDQVTRLKADSDVIVLCGREKDKWFVETFARKGNVVQFRSKVHADYISGLIKCGSSVLTASYDGNVAITNADGSSQSILQVNEHIVNLTYVNEKTFAISCKDGRIVFFDAKGNVIKRFSTGLFLESILVHDGRLHFSGGHYGLRGGVIKPVESKTGTYDLQSGELLKVTENDNHIVNHILCDGGIVLYVDNSIDAERGTTVSHGSVGGNRFSIADTAVIHAKMHTAANSTKRILYVSNSSKKLLECIIVK